MNLTRPNYYTQNIKKLNNKGKKLNNKGNSLTTIIIKRKIINNFVYSGGDYVWQQLIR